MKPFKRSAIIWLAMLAVALHAMLPLVHALSLPMGVPVVLCSATGSRTVYIQLSDTQKQHDPVLHKWASCSLCASGAHFALTSLFQPTFETDLRRHVLAAVEDGPNHIRNNRLSCFPRGPPQA